MTSLIISALLVCNLFLVPRDHAIYIATVEVTRSASQREAEVKIKVFTDDLQDVIRNYSSKYKPGAARDLISANGPLIAAYFQKNLAITINDELTTLEWVKGMHENDACFLQFSIGTPSAWEKLKVDGDFFCEVFADQSNVVTINNRDKRSFIRLTKSQPAYTFTFD